MTENKEEVVHALSVAEAVAIDALSYILRTRVAALRRQIQEAVADYDRDFAVVMRAKGIDPTTVPSSARMVRTADGGTLSWAKKDVPAPSAPK